MRVTGFILADDNSFTSSIRFHDTKKTVQPNLYATNLRLKNANPRIVLKNTSEVDVSVRPRFFSVAGEQDNPVELPAMTLQPQQTVDLDLSALTQAATSRPELNSVSVQVLNNGAPGSLIGAAYSKEEASQLTYDVPLRDSGKVRNTTGSYPWRIDHDYSTVVVVTNAGNQPARFQVEIRYPGGPYSIKPRQLEVGQTATFDLRKMRDEQQPDRLKKTLPLTLEQGQFHWSLVATVGEAHLVGRAEVVSRSARVASSYSCPVCCPDSGPIGAFDPNVYELYVAQIAAIGSNGQYYDCYNNWYPSSIYWATLFTYDPGIASVTGPEELHGEDTGSTTLSGSYSYVYWETDYMDCYQRYDTVSDNAPVDVACATPTNFHITSTTGFDAGNGRLHIEYGWGSSTGNLADLGQCTVTEKVDYNSQDLPFASPPFPANINPPNPTILPVPPVPGTDGAIEDNNSTPGSFVKPYSAKTITATQVWRYTCGCANNGQPVVFYGPHSIVRSVTQNTDGSWKFLITKDGKSATINPLP
jgi:hypothetical protein